MDIDVDNKISTQGQHRFERLSALFSGNNINARKIVCVGEYLTEYPVSVSVGWRFEAVIDKKRYDGSSSPSGCQLLHGYDLSGKLHQEGKVLLASQETRSQFLGKVQGAGSSFLMESTSSQLVRKSPSFYKLDKCEKCSGSGSTSCIYCSGTKQRACSSCNSTGWIFDSSAIYTVNERRRCEPCLSSGHVKCTTCNGTGKGTCSSCKGKGTSIEHGEARLMAVPSWQVPPIHGTGGGLLSAYLTKQGPKFAREVVPFELLQAKDTGGGLEAEYAGLASVAVITMELNGAPYVLMYAGVGATPLQKPAVFDDLLKPQLKVAEEFSNGKLTTASAGRVFSLFTSVPVLNKALENVAALRKPEPKDITQAVHAAAQGYISDDVAETLGKSLQRCLDKVSPTYSSRAWRLVVTPLALLVFLMASHIMDPMFVWRATAPLFSPFAALLGYEFNLIEVLYRSWSGFWQWLPLGYVLQIGLTHMSVAVCLLVLALPLIWLLSALFTSHGIKKLPPQYRRKPAHMRPFKKALVVQLAASALGSAVLMLIGS